jgi:hypothetical protein
MKDNINYERNDDFAIEKTPKSPAQDNLVYQSQKNKNYSLFSSLGQAVQQTWTRLTHFPFACAFLTLAIFELLTGIFVEYKAVDIAKVWLNQLEYKENITLEPMLSNFHCLKIPPSDDLKNKVLKLEQRVDTLEIKINQSNFNIATLETPSPIKLRSQSLSSN